MVTTSNFLQAEIFFVVRYLNGQNGIIFGIVRDDEIFSKWSEFFDVPVQVGNIYKIKLDTEFKNEARVLFKGSYIKNA